MNGMTFGGYQFSAPAALPYSSPHSFLGAQPGLYVILAYDPAWSPWPYRPLYFGESEDINRRATTAHEKLSSWQSAAGLLTPLYRALNPMPGTTKLQRQQAESQLIARYTPPCNERLSYDLGPLGFLLNKGVR